MAIAYAPFEDLPPRLTIKQTRPSNEKECDYLLMFFVGGVFLIALSDSLAV